jgi:hypothetical protein
VLAKGAFAASPEAAIERLWSLPDPSEEMFRDAARGKTTLGNWVKFHQSEPYKFRVINNVALVDGFNFVVTMVSCSADLLTPVGGPGGREEKTVGFKPPVYYKQVAVWEQEKKGCVNAFACSYEVAIEGLSDPSAKRTFGPVGAVGSTTAPDYDCFLDATDQVSME